MNRVIVGQPLQAAETHAGTRAPRGGCAPRLLRRRHAGVGLIDLLAFVLAVALAWSLIAPRVNAALARRNIAQARADLRMLGAALDFYRADHGAYPPSVGKPRQAALPAEIYTAPLNGSENFAPPVTSHRIALIPLTTPVAYLPRVDFNAPFPARAWEITEAERTDRAMSYWYCNYGDFHLTRRGFQGVAPLALDGCLVLAFGPRSRGVGGISAPYDHVLPLMLSAPAFHRPNVNNVYDPTNGAFSGGNLMRFCGRLGLEDGVAYIP